MVPRPPTTTRRALLRSGLLVTLGLAGCAGSPNAGNPSSTPTETLTTDRPPTKSPTNTQTDTQTPTEPPTGDAVHWIHQTGGSVRQQPTVRDGVVYVGGGTNNRATSEGEHVYPKTSENVYALAADDGSERWRYEAPAGIMSSPVVQESVFVVGGWDAGLHGSSQRLVRIDVGGSEAWTTELIDSYLSLLDIADGSAYLGTSDDALGVEGEHLFAVRTSNGNERWAIEAGDTRDAIVHGDTLYAVEGGRRTTAFATVDGHERWHRDMSPVGHDARVFGDAMYLEGPQNDDGNYPVVAVAAEDGSERWRFSVSVDTPFVPTGAVASNDAVYVTEYDGWLFALDPAEGTERWRYDVDGDTRSPPVLVDGTVYLASIHGSIHAVDAATGDRRWKRTLPGYPQIAAGNADGLVIRGQPGKEEQDQQPYLRAYAPSGTERWSFSYAGELTQPAVDGLQAYIGTETGYVVALAEN